MVEQLRPVGDSTAGASAGLAAQSAPFWEDQGRPAGGFTRPLGATTAQYAPGEYQCPYVFVLGNDGRMWLRWYNKTTWAWTDEGAPETGTGSGIKGPLGVITIRDYSGAPQRIYAFVQADDDEMWVRWWTGKQWQWSSEGAPPDVDIDTGLGAVAVQDASGTERPYVFVRGSDGNMWSRWWDGNNWFWSNNGKPGAAIGIREPLGIMALRNFNGSGEVRRPYVFVLGTDGQVWTRVWDNDGWQWSTAGKPPKNVDITGALGAVIVVDKQGAAEQPYVFVLGSDGNLWMCSWDGRTWNWSNEGAPSDGIAGPVGAVALPINGVRRPYVFVRTGVSTMWMFWFDGNQWNWTDQQAPKPGVALGYGAISVQNSPNSAPRPYAFIQDGSPDGDLWDNVVG